MKTVRFASLISMLSSDAVFSDTPMGSTPPAPPVPLSGLPSVAHGTGGSGRSIVDGVSATNRIPLRSAARTGAMPEALSRRPVALGGGGDGAAQV